MDQHADTDVVRIIATHQPGLERYVRSLVRDPDEAADFCQEVAVRLLVMAVLGGIVPEFVENSPYSIITIGHGSNLRSCHGLRHHGSWLVC